MSFIPCDYSHIAPIYDPIFSKLLAEGHREIGAIIEKEQKMSQLNVLEVGVGSGLSLKYLPSNINFSGIDINKRMLERAIKKIKNSRKERISLQLMNAERMRFPSEHFDFVFASSVLSAVRDPAPVMKEIIRVTKTGGRIAIIVNLREDKTLKSKIIKYCDPITKKCLGFSTSLESDFFMSFKNLHLIKNTKINNVFGVSLSNFILFEKV